MLERNSAPAATSRPEQAVPVMLVTELSVKWHMEVPVIYLCTFFVCSFSALLPKLSRAEALSLVPMPATTPTVLSEVFHGFLACAQWNSEMVH
jgi:hypothetical protein